jgi:hypothetical protein
LKQKSETSMNKNQSILTLFLIVILVGGGLYYYSEISHESDTQEVGTSVKGSDSSLDAITQAEAEIPPLKNQDFDFNELKKNNSCSTLGTLCSDMGLTYAQESISISEDKVIIYVNIESLPTDQLAEEFKKLSPSQKAEFIMGKKGTHPKLIEEVIKRNPTHLIIVGFNALDDIIINKHILNISYKQLPPMNEALHEFLFGEIFYNGKFKRYRKYVGYYSAFSNL